MEKNNTHGVISVVDLFAFCIKKFLVLLIGAIVGLALLLSFHIINSNSEKKLEEYNKAVARYNSSLGLLEKKIDNLNSRLESFNEYQDVSPFFSGKDVFKARVLFSIDSAKGVTITDTGLIVSEISKEVETIWNGLDISSIVGSPIETELLLKSWVFSSYGQMYEIIIYADSEETASSYATRILDYFIEFINGHVGDKVSYQSIVVSKATKDTIDEFLQSYISDRADLFLEIEQTEDELKSVRREEPSKYHITKFAVLGFLAGGIVTVLLLSVSFIFKVPLTSSYNVEAILCLPFLGALFSDKDLLSKLARRIICERQFRNLEESEKYIKNALSSKNLKEKKEITVVSSLETKDIISVGEKLCEILRESGLNATFVSNSTNNPEYVKVLENSDSVILLERQWKSRSLLVRSNIKNADSQGKEIVGFVLC